MSDAIYRKKEDVVTRKIAGEMILVPVCGELAAMQRIFSVDSVAEYIWESLDGKRSVASILAGITGTFDVDETTAEKDLHGFVDELVSAGLVEEVTGGV